MALCILCCVHTVPAQETPSKTSVGAELFEKECSSCHSIGGGEFVATDLKGITRRRERDWLIGFIQDPSAYFGTDPLAEELLFQYEEMEMPPIPLAREEIERILAYIASFNQSPPDPSEPPAMTPPFTLPVERPDERGGVSGPGVMLLGLTLILGAVLFVRGRSHSAQVVCVLALAVGYWSLGGRRHHVLFLTGNDQGYAPEQPIAFSHAQHAGDLEISCLYCHHGAAKGPVAGLPAVSTCMNCHQVVKSVQGQEAPSEEIAKLLAVWEKNEKGGSRSIEWVRVHDLADFVSFNHQVHVANGIQCQECHGPVETMDRMRQASSLSMGMCIDCHRLEEAGAPGHWRRAGASLDCVTCHY